MSSLLAAYPALDDAFKALADPSRRELLDSLNARNGQTLRELCAGLDMARQSVSKHLAVLAAADLVPTAWRGRDRSLGELARALEEPVTENPVFVFVS